MREGAKADGLVARLRQASVNILEYVGKEYRDESQLYKDAADEIERLRSLLNLTEYSECPECHARLLSQVHDSTCPRKLQKSDE